jgi:putative ABC transport system permease protein
LAADTLAKIRLNELTKEEIAARHLMQAVNVNESFARRFLRELEPVGATFTIGRDRFEVVGVVGDMRRDGPEHPAVAEFFSPYVGETSELAIRSNADPRALAASVQQTIRSIDKNAMVLSATTLERRLGEMEAGRHAQTWLLALFASLALILAAIGIYGIARYAVAQRIHEMGVRIALGAQASDIVRLIIRQGMIPPVIGMAIGLWGGMWVTAIMSHALFQVTPTDPATFSSVALILMSVTLVACYLPARRAARVDPIVALRHE